MEIRDSYFPVKEEPVFRAVVDEDGVLQYREIPKRKLIARADNDAYIADVQSSYKLIENRHIIEPILEYLEKTDIRYRLDTRNSYIGNDRTHFRIVYPDITIPDDSDQGLLLGHGIYNSYDGSGSVKVLDYLLRLACENGLTRVNKINGSIWAKHTSGFSLENYKQSIEKLMLTAPTIGERIQVLMNIEANQNQLETIEEISTTGMYKDLLDRIEGRPINSFTQWQILNILTYYISHKMKNRAMAEYQYRVGKLFRV